MKKLPILPIVLLAAMAAHRPIPAVSEPAVAEPAASGGAVSEPAALEGAMSEPAAPDGAAGQASQVIEGTITAEEPFDLPAQPWEGRVIALPGPEDELEKAALRPSFTTFTNSVVVGRRRYSFTEVGTDPSLRNARNAVVPIVIIPVQTIFDDGTVLDSTAPDACSGARVPLDLVLQTYGVAEFDSNRSFKAGADVSILAHELGEWYDDPLTNNPTPPWGHTGQVSGCQSNLEVGDPLTGHFLNVPMPNGMVYHPQELAFFSWFFDENPSLGFDGWYSMAGTFRAPAAACH